MRWLAFWLVAMSGAVSAGEPPEGGGTPVVGWQAERWELVTTPVAPLDAVVREKPEGVVAIAGRPTGFLQTRADFENFELHMEWRWPAQPGNAGILLHIEAPPAAEQIWPRCVQVQTKHGRAGDLLPMAGARFAEPLTTPPDAKVPQRVRQAESGENPAGEWNAADVVCCRGTIEVRINGVLQNRVTGCAPAKGRIGLQLENAPYEIRHLQIRRLAP